MSNHRTHVLVGLAIGIAFYLLVEQNILFIPIAMVYAMLPDIDIRTSKTYKGYVFIAVILGLLPFILPAFEIFSIPSKYWSVGALVALGIINVVHHREFFHSIVAGIVFAVPMSLLYGNAGYLLALSAFYSHLLLDDELFDGWFT